MSRAAERKIFSPAPGIFDINGELEMTRALGATLNLHTPHAHNGAAQGRQRMMTMRRFVFLVPALLGMLAAGQDMMTKTGGQDRTGGFHDLSFETTIVRKTGFKYQLFLPASYQAVAKPWPLILFLHGASDRGAKVEVLRSRGPLDGARDQGEFPAIVVSPICPGNSYWAAPDQMEALKALLDHVIETCRVDTNRIYLTGLSMGGWGTWSLAQAVPERFAALVPICGRGDPGKVERIKQIPVWAFHGALDQAEPVQSSERMVNALRACGGNVRYTVYPEAGHDSWTETYSNVELYAWLFEQRRGKAPAAPDKESTAFVRAWQQRIEHYSSHTNEAHCPKLAAPPTLDGRIDEREWAGAARLTGFRIPTGLSEAVHPTVVHAGYDVDALYLAFRCSEPNMAGLVAKRTKRDDPDLWQDDCVEVFLDANLDRETYYHIVVNPCATIMDGIGKGGDWTGAGIQAAAGREQGAWTVELAIPWADVGLKAFEPGTRIGLQLARSRAQAPAEISQWSVTLGSHHRPERFGLFVGSARLSSTR